MDVVACEWVTANTGRWRPWIPDATECTRSLGFGMVAEDGTFVQESWTEIVAAFSLFLFFSNLT